MLRLDLKAFCTKQNRKYLEGVRFQQKWEILSVVGNFTVRQNTNQENKNIFTWFST